MPGRLCARATLGWTLCGPASCSGLREFYFQFLPPNLEKQCCAISVPSVHISGSKILHMQKVGQVFSYLVASPGALDDGRGPVLAAEKLFPAPLPLDDLQPQLHREQVHVHTLPGVRGRRGLLGPGDAAAGLSARVPLPASGR